MKNSYAKSYGKYDKSLVDDIRPRAQGRTKGGRWTLSPYKAFVLTLTNKTGNVRII